MEPQNDDFQKEPPFSRCGWPSKNRGGFPPKSSILIGFSIINHPFWCTSIFGNTHVHFVVPSQFSGALQGQLQEAPIPWGVYLQH